MIVSSFTDAIQVMTYYGTEKHLLVSARSLSEKAEEKCVYSFEPPYEVPNSWETTGIVDSSYDDDQGDLDMRLSLNDVLDDFVEFDESSPTGRDDSRK